MQSSDEQLRSRLLQAYEADPDRSKMGRLRKQYDTIIDLQKGGMSLEKILIVLNEDRKPDDCLTMKTFNGYLYLLRKERKIQTPVGVELVAPQKPPRKPRKPPKKSGEEKQLDAPAAPGLLDEGTPKDTESSPDETGKNSNRPPRLLSENKGVWGKLKPSPVDGTVDLKQK